MKMQRPILVIDMDWDSARDSANLIFGFCRYSFILSEKLSRDTTVIRCRNNEPAFVFIHREILSRKEFSGLNWQINAVCRSINATVYAFSSLDELKRLIQTEKSIIAFLRKEGKNGSAAYNNVLSGLPFGG